MQLTRYAIAVAAVVASASALAERPAAKHVASAEDLIELCS